MLDELHEMYQQVILEHSRHPRHFGVLTGANRTAEGNNPLCGDHFTICVKLENDVAQEVSFQGAGCAVSKAAASLMTEAAKGKSATEIKQLAAQFQSMVKSGKIENRSLGDLSALAGVHKFPLRIKCALLPWEALLAALAGENKTVSTQEFT